MDLSAFAAPPSLTELLPEVPRAAYPEFGVPVTGNGSKTMATFTVTFVGGNRANVQTDAYVNGDSVVATVRGVPYLMCADFVRLDGEWRQDGYRSVRPMGMRQKSASDSAVRALMGMAQLAVESAWNEDVDREARRVRCVNRMNDLIGRYNESVRQIAGMVDEIADLAEGIRLLSQG